MVANGTMNPNPPSGSAQALPGVPSWIKLPQWQTGQVPRNDYMAKFLQGFNTTFGRDMNTWNTIYDAVGRTQYCVPPMAPPPVLPLNNRTWR
jgi:hypothetical protein